MASVPNGVENIAEKFNHLSTMHERYRQTTDYKQQTDRRRHNSERVSRAPVPPEQNSGDATRHGVVREREWEGADHMVPSDDQILWISR